MVGTGVSEQMFQMEHVLLLFKENNCAKLFQNPCINVEVMVLDLQPIYKNVSDGTSPPQGQQLCQIILKSMHKCRSNGLDRWM